MRHKVAFLATLAALALGGPTPTPRSRRASDDPEFAYEPIKRLKPRDKLKGKPWSRKKAKKSKKGVK